MITQLPYISSDLVVYYVFRVLGVIFNFSSAPLSLSLWLLQIECDQILLCRTGP